MAHVAKYTRQNCGQLFAHYERREGRTYSNKEIDLSRTGENYNLAPDRGMTQHQYLEKRLAEVHVHNRKDVKVMCDWVLTVPKELKDDREITKSFFEHAYQFYEQKYGKENVISAYVHMDETTPHMHFSFIPVIEDRKKGRKKVSAKEVLNREELRNFHSDLQMHLEKQMGMPVPVLNGVTEGGNRSIEELKFEKRKAEMGAEIEKLRSLNTGIKKIDRKGKTVLGNIVILKKNLNALKKQAKAYTANRDEIKAIRDTKKELEERNKILCAQSKTLRERESRLEGEKRRIRGEVREEVKQELKNRIAKIEAGEERVRSREAEIERKEEELRKRIEVLYDREMTVADKQEKTERLYDEQLNLNRLYEKLRRDNDEKKQQIKSLSLKNTALEKKVDDLTKQANDLMETCTALMLDAKKKIAQMCKVIANVLVGMKKIQDMGIFTAKQNVMLDSIEKYGLGVLEKEGAENCKQEVKNPKGLAREIDIEFEDRIKALERKQRSRSNDLER